MGEEDCVKNSKSVPKANASFDKVYANVQGHYKSNRNSTSEDKVECNVTVEAKLKLHPPQTTKKIDKWALFEKTAMSRPHPRTGIRPRAGDD